MQLHRVVRNPVTRSAYDRLQAAGITATLMREYVRQLADPPPVDPPEGYEVKPGPPERVAAIDAPVDDLLDGERIVGGVAAEGPAGYCFVSTDATVPIHPLERAVSFEGGYVRRVYVTPSHRRAGLARALVRRACVWAADRGADRLTALVAADNVPSRRLFESEGFRASRTHRYVRAGPLSHYSTVGDPGAP